jgi:hypothetical protein
MRRHRVKSDWRLVFVVAALATPGCGGADVARVTGHVKRTAGEPLADASLIARNEATGVSCYATTDAQGKYELTTGEPGAGVPPGSYSVVVMEKKASRDSVSQPTIAAKYGDPAQSGLSFAVEAGDAKSFDISIDSP